MLTLSVPVDSECSHKVCGAVLSAPGGSAVKIKSLDVEPHPVRVPGMVRLYLDAEVMKPFTNFDLNVTLIKEVNGEKLTVRSGSGVRYQ